MKTGRFAVKRVAVALLILLLLLILFRLASFLLLPAEPVALVPGLRYSAGPLCAVLRFGLPKEIDSHLSEWRAVYYEFSTELDGTPAEVELRFADGLWLTELWVRAEAEDSVQAESLFRTWCERLDTAYRDADGCQNHGITKTGDGKEIRMEINKGALGLSCILTQEGNVVTFHGNDLW